MSKHVDMHSNTSRDGVQGITWLKWLLSFLPLAFLARSFASRAAAAAALLPDFFCAAAFFCASSRFACTSQYCKK